MSVDIINGTFGISKQFQEVQRMTNQSKIMIEYSLSFALALP